MIYKVCIQFIGLSSLIIKPLSPPSGGDPRLGSGQIQLFQGWGVPVHYSAEPLKHQLNPVVAAVDMMNLLNDRLALRG